MSTTTPLSPTTEFADKRVLVTGGTKGIGKAVAARLRHGGAAVFTTARNPSSDLADSDLFIAADIASAEGCMAVANAVTKRLGGIDIITARWRCNRGWRKRAGNDVIRLT